MKDLGPYNHFLGIRIARDRAKRTTLLLQDTYIQKILENFQLDKSNTYQSPMEETTLQQLTPYEGDATKQEIFQYQSAIGSLQHLSIQTRADISFATGALARFNHNPSPLHWKAVQRVMKYLHGTKLLGVSYEATGTEELNLHGYSDADFAGDIATRKSTAGYVFFCANGPISWKSARLTAVTLSVTESEYYGLTNAAKEAKWIAQLLSELTYDKPDVRTILIHGDNTASINWSQNPESHQRSKHIDVKWHYIRQEVNLNSIRLEHKSTHDMTADGLTKPLSIAKHKRFVAQLGMRTLQ